VRSAPKIILSPEERTILEQLIVNPESPRALKRRSKTILACAEGKTNIQVGREVGLTNLTVGKLRAQFLCGRLQDFEQERRGRPIPPILLNSDERAFLEDLVSSVDGSIDLARKARAILACAEAKSNFAVARETGISPISVGKFRRRFLIHGLVAFTPDAKNILAASRDGYRNGTFAGSALRVKELRNCRPAGS
jgi:hypothetical protein